MVGISKMSIFKKRRYYFSDTSVASDTIIAYAMCGVAIAMEISGIVASIVTKGNVSALFGILYICAMLLSVVGEIFAWLGKKAEEGGETGKRVSIILNILAFLFALWIIFMGIIAK